MLRKSMYYVSLERSGNIYSRQKKLLLKLDFPILDYWQLAHDMAEFLKPADARHFNEKWNKFTFDHFFDGIVSDQNVPQSTRHFF